MIWQFLKQASEGQVLQNHSSWGSLLWQKSGSSINKTIIVMNTITYQNNIQRQVYRMFESFYNTNADTLFPPVVDAESVVASKGKDQLTIKHMMAQLALGNIISEAPMNRMERQHCLANLAKDFEEDSTNTIKHMDEIFDDLLQLIISLN